MVAEIVPDDHVLREVLASLFNRVLDPQQKCSLPLIKLGELVELEQLSHISTMYAWVMSQKEHTLSANIS